MFNRIKYLKSLASIILSDGEIAPKEEKFFIEIVRSLGIDLSRIEDILLLEKIKPVPTAPVSKEERMIQLYGMALMIKSDNKIKPEETNTLKNIGLEMGLPTEGINEMLQLLFSTPYKTLTEKELVDIFKKYEN
jgi:uncharacterized tellurite resistance protein B-like protein